MRMGCKLSPQSHFTCLFHDHANCSCIGGPRRLVQSHFTCHSHEWSLSLFFVMHVHRTYTSIRVSCICMGCSVLASFLVFSSCCSSVSVSAPTFGSDVFALSDRCFSTRNIVQQICLSFPNTSVIADCHVGILAPLVVFCFLRARRISSALSWTRSRF